MTPTLAELQAGLDRAKSLIAELQVELAMVIAERDGAEERELALRLENQRLAGMTEEENQR